MTEETLTVVNFTHPITAAQRDQLASLSRLPVGQVIDVVTQVDQTLPFDIQAVNLVNAASLGPTEWQTLPLIVNLPGLAPLAAVLLAELHGRLGYFPTIMRIRPVPGIEPTRYEVAELIGLQTLRDAARRRRSG